MLQRGYRKEESLARHWAGQVIELCEEIDDDTLTEFIEPVQQAIKALDHDRRVLFIGDSKSGKSSLLAGIAQYPAIAKAEMTEVYRCWRYRNNDGDATCSTFIPLENLEGLELTDTAAAEDAANQETIKALMKAADAVVAVLDASRIEESAVWDLLATLSQERRNATLLAVTHTDKLGAEEALKLKDKLRDYCRKRISSTPAIYFISPTTMKGMDGFTQRVQEALNAPHGLRADIRKVITLSSDLLNKQYHILRARESVSQNDYGFLNSIDKEIDNFLSHQMTGIKNYTDAYSDAAIKALPATLAKLKQTFGYWLSPVTLVRLNLFGAGTENYYYNMICREILSRQEVSDANFVLSCSGHWNHVRPRMKKAMECEIGNFPEEELHKELSELRVRLGRDLYKPFNQEKLRSKFAAMFNKCARGMQCFIFGICLCLIAAGITGLFGQTQYAVWLVACAGILWAVGSLFHWGASVGIRKEVVQLGNNLQESMLSNLAEDIKTMLISRVSAYRKLYTEPRRKVARNESMLKPLQQKHLNVTRQISTIMPR